MTHFIQSLVIFMCLALYTAGDQFHLPLPFCSSRDWTPLHVQSPGQLPFWSMPEVGASSTKNTHLPSRPLESCMKLISSKHQNRRDSLVAASRPHTEHTALSWACVEAWAHCWGAFVIWWQSPQPDLTELPESRLLLLFQLLCSGTQMWTEVQGQHQLSCHTSITYHLK